MIGGTVRRVGTTTVAGIRYRCSLGLWGLAALMVLPLAVITLFGPAFIAVSEALAG